MSKTAKGIIAASAVILVLVALMLILIFMPDKTTPESEQTSSSQSTVSLNDKTAADVDKIDISNSYGEYTVSQANQAEYKVSGLENIKLDSELLGYMMTSSSQINALRLVVDKAENEEEFGFYDKTSEKVNITYKDGTSFSLIIGGTDPSGDNRYVKVNGEDKIYLFSVESISYFKRPVAYFADKTLTESFNSSSDAPAFTKVVLKNENMPDGIVIEQNPAYNAEDEVITEKQYMITSPSTAYVDESKSGGVFIRNIFGKKADDAIVVSPTQAQLESYGLLNPKATLTFSYNGKEVTLSVGNENELGGYYIMTSDSDVVYSAGENIVSFKDLKYHEIIADTFFRKSVDKLSSITVTSGDKEYLFSVKSDADGKITATYNGKELDEIKFKTFYQLLTLLSGEFETTDKPTGESLAEIKISYSDNAVADDVVKISAAGDRRVYLTVNGTTDWLTRSSVVEKLVDSCEKLINGNDIDINW